jgi:Cu/Zn superoxide dismutase
MGGGVVLLKDGKAHGAHGSSTHHAGDLPCYVADMNGNAKLSFETSASTVDSGAADIVGLPIHLQRVGSSLSRSVVWLSTAERE